MQNKNTKRLKKLKDLSGEEVEEEKIKVVLSKEEKKVSLIPYDVQAANHAANSGNDKLDKFKVKSLIHGAIMYI